MEIHFESTVAGDDRKVIGHDDVNQDEQSIEQSIDSSMQNARLLSSLYRSKVNVKNETKRELSKMLSSSRISNKEYDKTVEIYDSLKDDFWTKNEHTRPEKLAERLVEYARERLDREKKKNDMILTAEFNENIKNVIERTKYYIVHPAEKLAKMRNVPAVREKEWGELSASSRALYLRAMKQEKAELSARGCKTSADMVAYLAEIAEKNSRSTYVKHRACLLQIAVGQENKVLVKAIKSMPTYNELCELLHRRPTSRTGEITRARAKKKDTNILRKIRENLNENYKDAVSGLEATGCRIGELSSMCIHKNDDDNTIKVYIKSSKTGCRVTEAPVFREMKFDMNSDEYYVLQRLQEKYGNEPFKDFKPARLHSAWMSARKKVSGNADTQTYCLHSFRHNFATREKMRINREMVEKHGSDWRRKLYGEDWRNNKDYYNTYSELSEKLGHSSYEMTKIYG